MQGDLGQAPGQELVHQHKAIVELIQFAPTAVTPRQLAASVVAWLGRTLQVDYCEVLQLTSDEAGLLPCALLHPEAIALDAVILIEPGSQAEYTLRHSGLVVVTDFRTEARFTAPLLPYHQHAVSGISVAVGKRDRPFGILNVASTQRRAFSREQLDFVRAVAKLIGMVMAQWEADQTIELQSALLNVIEEAVVAVDPEGRIIAWNQAAMALYGVSAREALGRDMLSVIPLFDDASAAHEWLARLRRGQRWSGEYQVPRPGGFTLLLRVHWLPLRSASGMVIGMASLHSNVSEQRWIEQARRQAQERLEQKVEERTQELLQANRRLQQEIAERDRLALELSEMRRLLHQSQEAERLRLARELHDGPLQDLTALSLELSLLAATASEEEKAAQIQALRAKQERTTRQLRLLTQQLRPPMVAHFGLAKALVAQVEQARTTYGKPAIEVETPDEPLELDNDASLELFRIYQQALQNALQHANAEHIRIRLWTEGESVWLEVEDDGQGFEAPVQWLELARSGHFGMIGMLERAEALGGRLIVHSAPGEGTRIQVQAPLIPSAEKMRLSEP